MPQLDFTTYSSQIFWFSICFALLYFFVGKIILPRIYNIINERKTAVDSDLALAKDLDNRLENIQSKTNSLRDNASKGYNSKLEEASKTAIKERDRMVEELKEKLDQSAQKSRQEIKSFIEQSKTKSDATVIALVQSMKEKIFGKEII